MINNKVTEDSLNLALMQGQVRGEDIESFTEKVALEAEEKGLTLKDDWETKTLPWVIRDQNMKLVINRDIVQENQKMLNELASHIATAKVHEGSTRPDEVARWLLEIQALVADKTESSTSSVGMAEIKQESVEQAREQFAQRYVDFEPKLLDSTQEPIVPTESFDDPNNYRPWEANPENYRYAFLVQKEGRLKTIQGFAQAEEGGWRIDGELYPKESIYAQTKNPVGMRGYLLRGNDGEPLQYDLRQHFAFIQIKKEMGIAGSPPLDNAQLDYIASTFVDNADGRHSPTDCVEIEGVFYPYQPTKVLAVDYDFVNWDIVESGLMDFKCVVENIRSEGYWLPSTHRSSKEQE